MSFVQASWRDHLCNAINGYNPSDCYCVLSGWWPAANRRPENVCVNYEINENYRKERRRNRLRMMHATVFVRRMIGRINVRKLLS